MGEIVPSPSAALTISQSSIVCHWALGSKSASWRSLPTEFAPGPVSHSEVLEPKVSVVVCWYLYPVLFSCSVREPVF
jgi:hypothetical protein